MLVHICCSVDSHFFLEKLREEFPEEKLTGFFYDPNIHPYSEYKLRFLDVQRSCKKLGIDLIEGEYDFENWIAAVRGLEKEPEKGARCEVCFDKRFMVSAQKALELGEKSFTTTLLVSPLKSQQQLKKSGEEFEAKTGIKFIAVDYRSKGGTQDQSRVTKQQQLYRQDYCGCIYGLTLQREAQEKLMDEMFSPISGALLPASIEERLELYQRRMELEERNIPYRITKHKFLNYRQLSCRLLEGKTEVIAAHAVAYSTLPRKKAQGRIEYTTGELHHFNRDEIKFITLQHYNSLLGTNYTTLTELIYSPPELAKEHALRMQLLGEPYDLTPLIVVDEIPSGKLTVELDARVYEDTKEKLIEL